jgi:hypothetical protein
MNKKSSSLMGSIFKNSIQLGCTIKPYTKNKKAYSRVDLFEVGIVSVKKKKRKK